ncbi:MAG: alpha/beta hydrolase [Pseudomonadota bacterium]
MPNQTVNGIRLAYEWQGPEDGPVLVLIQGLSMPLNAWPPTFVTHFTDAGYRVLTLDNRDIGLSQTFDSAGIPNIMWEGFKARLRLPVNNSYSLDDMAADVSVLMGSLGVQSAHVAGVSMGGMIAQLLAIHHPQRVDSLTSIMSTTGNRRLPPPEPPVLRHMLRRPATDDVEARVEYAMKTWRLIASPGFDVDFEYLERRLRSMYERGVTRGGAVRQMLAIAAAPSRVKALRKVRIPTLVIHGRDDPLVPVACGADTANAIPNSRFEVIDGMGHDLPIALHERISGMMLEHMQTHAPSTA